MIVFHNVKALYDGTSSKPGAVHRAADLWIDGGRIHELRPTDPRLVASDSLTLVDCSDLTITPGLVDCHGHITALGLSAFELDRMVSRTALLWIEKVLYTTLIDGGVTTMRDIGGATHEMKQLVDDGVVIGPRLKIAICMLSTTGGHADFRGFDRCHATLNRIMPEGPGRPSSIVDGPWECRKRVREIAACGADLIKLCTSPGVASPGDKLEHREFTPDEIQAICDEAAHRGLRVAAHAHSRSGIAMAIEHGVHDIQHISFMDKALVDQAYERGCTVTPTSWIIQELVNKADLNPFVREKAKQVAEHHHHATSYARSGGLKILAGTDPVLPTMHGRNYRELETLMAEGLPALEAWYGGTGLAAEEIGQSDAGSLRPGQRADFLVARGDVVEQPARLETALLEVVKDGVGYRGHFRQLPQRSFRTSVDEAVQRTSVLPS